MAGSSAYEFARASYRNGLLSRRQLARGAWANVQFRLHGSTDAATDELRARIAKAIEGVRVVELQRLGPAVLAGVLPRIYPQMLQVAWGHQDAGRKVVPVTAFSYNVAASTCAQTEGASCILGSNPAFLSSEAIKLAVDILDGKPKPADRHILVTGDFLATNGGAWKSETAWVDSGGGVSPDRVAIPSWQQISGVITTANKGSTTLRNGPDVAANANFTFYTCDNQTTCQANTYGGTSFAAPMWAGLVALANQQAASTGKSPVGFFNPKIYAQNVTASYSTGFHDITSGTSGSYKAGTNFDLVTGWGSPKPAIVDQLLK